MDDHYGLSKRTAWPSEPSRWITALARARAEGAVRHELATTNPTHVGLAAPASTLARVGAAASPVYTPHPLGARQAREAIAQYYDNAVDPEQVWLCASTSEAYVQLLTLLCDPGDAVALPRPGYPLLDVLAQTSGVNPVGYRLAYDGRWHLDRASLRRTLTRHQPRAVVSVSPNNPTSHLLDRPDRAALDDACGAQGPALIIDEVFADYSLDGRPPERGARLATRAGLAFVLSGLSKVAALPQVKLSWVVVTGTAQARIDEVLRRAPVLSDAFLSATPAAQLALPDLLADAPAIQAPIAARARANLRVLETAAVEQPWEVLNLDAGWTALVRLPRVHSLDDEGWAIALLKRAGVVTSPGFLFDAPSIPPLLAISLIGPRQAFADGVAALRTCVAQLATA